MISCKFLWKYTKNHFNGGVIAINQPFARMCKKWEEMEWYMGLKINDEGVGAVISVIEQQGAVK